MVRTSREVSSRDLHCNSTSSGLEHVPAKCARFADKNMLQHIDPGALSYRRNDSISTESALKPRSGIAFSRLGFADLLAAGIERGDCPLVSMGSVRRTRTLVSEETGRHR